MRSIRAILIILTTALFAGCPVRSVFPLFTEKDAVFNPSLIGTWESEDETYTFEKLQEKNYRLAIRPKKENDSALYVVWLGKIGARWFLDSYPIVNSEEYHYFSMHLFTRMDLNGDTLRIASLEADWLSKMIDEKKMQFTHVLRGNEVILTGSTTELQKLLATIGGTGEAFPNENVFIKTKQ